MTSATDDLRAHFFTAVGQLLDQAAMGRLHVRVELCDGGTVEGVPSRTDEPAVEELAETGYPVLVNVGRERVGLEHVRSATIIHPDCSEAP